MAFQTIIVLDNPPNDSDPWAASVFRQAKCTASLIPDHYPELVGDKNHRLADTYSLAYMRALLRRANEEVG